jgi:hypothetical protein
MKTIIFFSVICLASCGGKLLSDEDDGAGSEHGSPRATGSVDAGSSGSGSGSQSGSATGNAIGTSSGTSDGSTGQPDPIAEDAAVACPLPPVPSGGNGGQCNFCNNKWYCPQPQTPPSRQCPPDMTLYGPCSSSCIACGNVNYPQPNIAWFWTCTSGVVSQAISYFASCTP